jgi:Ran GTPase-activating protein (RanGAP) involved in mRNA processing and transport
MCSREHPYIQIADLATSVNKPLATTDANAGQPWSLILLFLQFGFSLFCFFGSFCFSVWLFDFAYEYFATNTKRFRLRPYSPTLLKLSTQLERSCQNEDAKVRCLVNQCLSSAEFVEVVLPMISQHKADRWKSLDLSSNEISNAGLEKLFQALLHEDCTCHLEQIWLKRCGISSITPSLVGYLEERGSSLTELSLGYNRFVDDGARVLAAALPKSNLKVLNLNNNDITDVGIQYLAAGVSGSTDLIELNLRGNKVMDEGAKLLGQAIRCTKLQSLDISCNPVTDEGVNAIVEALPMSSLAELFLGDNPFVTDSPILKLTESSRSHQLRVLNLTNMRLITDLSVKALTMSIRKSAALLSQVIIFGNLQLSPSCVDELQETLQFANSAWFRTVIVLCSVHGVQRLGVRSPFREMPKDLIRLIASKLQPFSSMP